ncbi:MAG: hypothetical protein ACK4TA_12545 [Saprospiraceae bacterium]
MLFAAKDLPGASLLQRVKWLDAEILQKMPEVEKSSAEVEKKMYLRCPILHDYFPKI